MKAEFTRHINEHFPFLKEKNLLLAVSGGLDSVVMSHLIHSMSFSVALAHCNFNLRGESSDKDQVFVEQLAAQLGLTVATKKFNTQDYAKKEKCSIQVAARTLRYQWFDELLAKEHFDFVLTAHHADDNLETFIINLSRGTGLDGLTGIPQKNKKIIRPLLPFSREQIEHYAKENAIAWREDLSNLEDKYLRNKIRHSVVPALKELTPSFLNAFNKTLEHLKMSRDIIDKSIETLSINIIEQDAHGLALNIAEIEKLSNTKAYLFEFLKAYNFTEFNDVSQLLTAQSGKQVLSATHRLIKDRDKLLLTELKEKNEFEYSFLKNEQVLSTPFFTLEAAKVEQGGKNFEGHNEIMIDLEKIKFPLLVRKWKSGDYFYPLGMTGKKKLSKFFKDEKMSLPQKEKIWLLCSAGEIVWLMGKRLDNRYKITEQTKQILKITLQ